MAGKQTKTTKSKCPSGLSRARKQVWKQINELILQRPLELTQWREVGLLVTQYLELGSKSKKRGEITSLGQSLGAAHSELYYVQQLAREHEEKELRTFQTKGFGWGKMMYVLSIEAPEARRELIEDALRDDWSVRRLKAEIHQRHGYQATPASRSKGQPEYAGFKEGLHELVRQCRNWMRYHNSVWLGEPSSMVKDLEGLSPDEVDESLLELLREAKGELRRVTRAVFELEGHVEEKIESVLKARTEVK